MWYSLTNTESLKIVLAYLNNMLLIYQHVLLVWHVLSILTLITDDKYFNT